jgi:hypothetical protein
MRVTVPMLIFLADCATAPAPREPGLAGFLHILRAARDSREACAGLGRDCGPASLEENLARAERGAPAELLLDSTEAREERPMAEAALQAAHADCRGRGIQPGSPRWDRCRLDRGIARLAEAAGEDGAASEHLAGTGWNRRAAHR